MVREVILWDGEKKTNNQQRGERRNKPTTPEPRWAAVRKKKLQHPEPRWAAVGCCFFVCACVCTTRRLNVNNQFVPSSSTSNEILLERSPRLLDVFTGKTVTVRLVSDLGRVFVLGRNNMFFFPRKFRIFEHKRIGGTVQSDKKKKRIEKTAALMCFRPIPRHVYHIYIYIFEKKRIGGPLQPKKKESRKPRLLWRTIPQTCPSGTQRSISI